MTKTFFFSLSLLSCALLAMAQTANAQEEQWKRFYARANASDSRNQFHRSFRVSHSQQIPVMALTPPSTVTAQRGGRFSREFALPGRAEIAFSKTLVYGNAGYDFTKARIKSTDSFNDLSDPGIISANDSGVCLGPNCYPNIGSVSSDVIASESRNISGLTFGFGVADKFGLSLSAGFEYLQTDLRSKTFTLSNQTMTNVMTSVNVTNNPSRISPIGVISEPTSISLKSDLLGVLVNFYF